MAESANNLQRSLTVKGGREMRRVKNKKLESKRLRVLLRKQNSIPVTAYNVKC